MRGVSTRVWTVVGLAHISQGWDRDSIYEGGQYKGMYGCRFDTYITGMRQGRVYICGQNKGSHLDGDRFGTQRMVVKDGGRWWCWWMIVRNDGRWLETHNDGIVYIYGQSKGMYGCRFGTYYRDETGTRTRGGRGTWIVSGLVHSMVVGDDEKWWWEMMMRGDDVNVYKDWGLPGRLRVWHRGSPRILKIEQYTWRCMARSLDQIQ